MLNEGRVKMLKGVDVLANAVSVTLGPKGQFTFICSEHESYGGPKIPKVPDFYDASNTNRTYIDGVTVAKSISLKKKFKNLGARYVFLRFSSRKPLTPNSLNSRRSLQNECSCWRRYNNCHSRRAIYSEGFKNAAAGCNPMDLRCGSQAAVDRVAAFLPRTPKLSRPPQKSPKSLPSP
ncbi:hypothetical protein FA15DRAFT_650913 [Coprinopsis marcescibilis]|uniref:Uncharacterized protein n=1 Tax=Coprinopsis marcescibilis TaxID=230819 RepID=A0A5C3K977_COPMA|nr:hypothetical protein FA15DRAFT_650913 [Coprinopsis marcescibilis]